MLAGKVLCSCLLLLTLASPLGAWARESDAGPETEPDRLLLFADGLVRQGEYYRAITEYLRFASYFPRDARVEQLPLRIALANLLGGRPEEAWQAAQKASGSASSEVRNRAAFLQARAYYLAGEYGLALENLEPLAGDLHDASRLHRLASSLRSGQIELAEKLLKEEGGGLEGPIRDSLLERLQGQGPPKFKSPKKAGWLSAILPGAGQLYAGRKRDALVSFILNGLFIAAAVDAFTSGHEVTGIIVTTVETGWYVGNIVSASNSARRFNQQAFERYLATTADLPGLERQLRIAEQDLILGLRIRF